MLLTSILWLFSDSIFISLLTVLFTGIVSCYTLYYIFRKVSKPQLSCGQGTFRTHLLEHCPILRQPYWPTWWAFNRHVMTIGRSVLQRRPHLKYKREIFTTPDEGELALDWYDTDYNDSHIEEDAPILLILPGLTSTSGKIYIQWLVCDGASQGYRPVVMNYRGFGGIPLKTSRAFCANTDDIGPVINHIQKCWPNSPIAGLGVSLGGIILIQHIIATGEQCGLVAVVTFSSPWNFHTSSISLEKTVNRLIYNRHLTGQLIQYVESNYEVLITKGVDLDPELPNKARRSSTLTEFDNAVTVPVFGYNSVEEYYTKASNCGKIDRIKTPLISVSAVNDPFVPPETLPVVEFEANSNTMLVVVQHGGHFGFLEGWFPRGRTWMNRVTQEVLGAIKTFKRS